LAEVMPPGIPLLAILLGLVVVTVPFGYAIVAVFLNPRWEVGPDGITVRAAALLWFPLRIPWASLERVQTVGWGGGVAALKLDGRYLFQRHVTLIRKQALRIRFTPRDVDAFESALCEALQSRAQWERTEVGWARRAA
jgi:hypothetical protein